MLEYRAYLIGRDGHIVHRVDILCVDDEAAKSALNSSSRATPQSYGRMPVW
jgi:hypothetical protein